MTIHTSLARLSVLLLMAPLGLWAATPASGTLTDTSPPLTYTSGPFNVANATPVPQVDVGPRCNDVPNGDPCDFYNLAVTLPTGYHAAHPNASIKVTESWTDAGSGKSDYDIYIYKGTITSTDGSMQADAQASSAANPEVADFGGLIDGTANFTVIQVPYTPSGEMVNVKIELLPGSGGSTGPFGGPDPTVAGAPRYQNFYAPNGSSAQPGSGEFNIGFNPATHRIMTMNSGPIWRVTPAEVVNTANPESCDALWEDKSSSVTNTGLDPILWTDQKSGRTFAVNETAGGNGSVYSDNDGDSWTPGGGLPNGGADHETIGTGPYPTSLAPLITPVNQGQYTLYCSQDVVGPANCQRSDTLGATYGPGVPAYTGSGAQGCGGLHGHVHIAPNGTAWLPVNQCNGRQGGAVSTDAGTTWSEFAVTKSISQTNGADPSIALDSASTAYYCYVNNEPVPVGNAPEGHVHVKVSTDGGLTWIRDVDVGATHGVVNAAHTEAVGGSAGRAACGFLGTNVPGDYQSLSFPGLWYAFIATTLDGGMTWTTVNATPNDPVQSKTGIWQQGGGNQDRNLLDFNEVTMDDKGRVLYGYSDGCTSPTCITGNGTDDFTAWMRVARQIGGKGLLASADPVEPAPPKRSCLAGSRDPSAAHLSWKIPDNNGKDILAYNVYRGTASGSETYLGQTQRVNSYDDATADPSVAAYYYTVKAINLSGTGNDSNEVKLTAVVPPPPGSICTAPGLTLLTDPAGDNSTGTSGVPAPAGTDLLSFQLEQPLALDGVVKLLFTLNTDAGMSPQSPGSAWYVAMKIADTTPAGFHYRGVHMAWSGTTPTFESYTPSANTSGGVDGRFVTPGSQVPAEFGSYDTPFNKVVIGVKASDLGLHPGDVITGFLAGTSQTTDVAGAGGATEVYDFMPNSATFSGGPYTVGNSFDCDVIFRNGFE